MSTRLNVTYNLFGLSNALGLEKQAVRLLRDSITHLNPSRDTIRSMRNVVANAPRARSGALSPTNMVDYIANNTKNLPGFAPEFGVGFPASNRFAAEAYLKARDIKNKAAKALSRYFDRIRSGDVDTLDPATLKRMNQLKNRLSDIRKSYDSMDKNLDNLDALVRRYNNVRN